MGIIMRYWLITDTHLGHKAMVRMCGRPENFDRLIMEGWKKCVQANDMVIHLGDAAWDDEHLKKLVRLPGRKILVRGNHDKKSLQVYMEMGFSMACDAFMMKLGNVSILFSHWPRYGHSYDINIHGHQHDIHRESRSRLFLPLALETMGYGPILMGEIFLQRLSTWVERFQQEGQVPTDDEIKAIGTNPIAELRQRDLYGRFTPQELAERRLLLDDAGYRALVDPDMVQGELAALRRENARLKAAYRKTLQGDL